MLTRIPLSVAPSTQTLPDHLQDTLKFSPRSVPRLEEEDEEEPQGWNQTLRPKALESSAARTVAHSRESSLEKLSQPSLPPPSGSIASPRSHASQSRGGFGGTSERLVDLKSPASYGHHRQTSIVHGIQHSRNGSLASSSSSPLSPRMIAAAGAGFVGDRPGMPSMSRLDVESRPTTALSGTTVGAASMVAERSSSANDPSVLGVTQRNADRMHSRTRRDHSHHHSHSSRHHKEKVEQKTVGEYALHVLFTTVGARLFHLKHVQGTDLNSSLRRPRRS